MGDVIGFPALASTSAEQGRLAACHAFAASADSTPDYFPLGIYAVPEISIVGKTEQQLRKDGVAYETGVARLRETARGQIQGVQEGLLKLIFDLKDHKLLGAHIVGEGATELIHIGQAVHRPRRHTGVLRRRRLQLPHLRRGLQDRRPGRLEPRPRLTWGQPHFGRRGVPGQTAAGRIEACPQLPANCQGHGDYLSWRSVQAAAGLP